VLVLAGAAATGHELVRNVEWAHARLACKAEAEK
jgi:hypothetical protein